MQNALNIKVHYMTDLHDRPTKQEERVSNLARLGLQVSAGKDDFLAANTVPKHDMQHALLAGGSI